jgi:hypothetical protein
MRSAVFVARVLPECAEAAGDLREMAEEFEAGEADELRLAGLPIHLEHNDELVVGTVEREWMQGNNKMILGRVHGSNFSSQLACEGLDNGWLADVSLQHSYTLYSMPGEGGLVLSKRPIEVSLCAEGAREGSHVLTHACGTVACTYKSGDGPPVLRRRRVKCSAVYAMADTTADAPMETAAPVAPVAAETLAAPAPPAAEPMDTEAPPPEQVSRDDRGRYAQKEDKGASTMAEAMTAMMTKLQQALDANESLGKENEELQSIRVKEAERAQAEETKALEMKRKKGEALLATLQGLGSATEEQLQTFTRMMDTDIDSAAQAIEVAVSCSRAEKERSEKKLAELQTQYKAVTAERELARMFGERYANMNIRRASAGGYKRMAADSPVDVPSSKIPSVSADGMEESGGRMPLLAAMEKKIATSMVYTIDPQSTYNDCHLAVHRMGLVRKSAHREFDALQYEPTPSPCETAGFGLMHANPELWAYITGSMPNDVQSHRTQIIGSHVAASKRRYMVQ